MRDVEITARPLSNWPAEATHPTRQRSPFAVTWSRTVYDLKAELRRLNVYTAILDVDVMSDGYRDIRKDGAVREDARILSPRVILSFTHPEQGALRYPCDAFTHWQANVRAIALGLEALRKVERYGIASRAQQYSGWKALPASITPALSVEQARRLIVERSGMALPQWPFRIPEDVAVIRDACRKALAVVHPDNGGRSGDFALVNDARRVLFSDVGL